MREWHPDKSDHPDAEQRFLDIVEAYQVLSDPELRKVYDQGRDISDFMERRRAQQQQQQEAQERASAEGGGADEGGEEGGESAGGPDSEQSSFFDEAAFDDVSMLCCVMARERDMVGAGVAWLLGGADAFC